MTDTDPSTVTDLSRVRTRTDFVLGGCVWKYGVMLVVTPELRKIALKEDRRTR